MDTAVKSTVEFAESGLTANYSGEKVKTTPTNKREQRLVNFIDKNMGSLSWCNIVEKTIDTYQFSPHFSIIQLKFFKAMSVRYVCYQCGISRSTFFRYQDEILETAEKWAKKYRLI